MIRALLILKIDSALIFSNKKAPTFSISKVRRGISF